VPGRASPVKAPGALGHGLGRTAPPRLLSVALVLALALPAAARATTGIGAHGPG